MASRGAAYNTEDNLELVYGQLEEDILPYNQAVGSFNMHLNNHRERRDLYDLSYRDPVTAVPANEQEMRDLLARLNGEVHLDSTVRIHPRTYPIHEEAVQHLEIARDALKGTLEDGLRTIMEQQ